LKIDIVNIVSAAGTAISHDSHLANAIK
jgi:hypothetical protein